MNRKGERRMSYSISSSKFYTLGEEIFNSVSHGIGTLLAIACCAVAVVFTAFTGDPWRIVSASVYGACMIFLFLFSTLYHAIAHKGAKNVLRKFDHLGIFLLIAGSYMPLTLIVFRGVLGWVMFGVIWFAAILGVVLNSINVERFKKFSMITYVLMGWAVIVTLGPLVKSVATGGVTLLAVGGIMYTVGIVFYKLQKKVRYMHSIWHLFVIAGALFQFFGIFFYILL